MAEAEAQPAEAIETATGFYGADEEIAGGEEGTSAKQIKDSLLDQIDDLKDSDSETAIAELLKLEPLPDRIKDYEMRISDQKRGRPRKDVELELKMLLKREPRDGVERIVKIGNGQVSDRWGGPSSGSSISETTSASCVPLSHVLSRQRE